MTHFLGINDYNLQWNLSNLTPTLGEKLSVGIDKGVRIHSVKYINKNGLMGMKIKGWHIETDYIGVRLHRFQTKQVLLYHQTTVNVLSESSNQLGIPII